MWIVRSCLWCLNGCLLWLARLGLLAGLTLGALVWAAQRAPVTLPDAAVAGLEAVLDRRAAQAGLTMTLDGADVALRAGLVPRLMLREVVLRRKDGTGVLRVAEADAVFSRSAALQGRLAPVALTARGLTVALDRDAQGAISVRLGAAALVDTAPDTATALTRLTAVLDHPSLSGLRRVGLEDVTLDLRDAVDGRVLGFADGALRLDRSGGALRVDLSMAVPARGAGGGVISVWLDVPGAGIGQASARGATAAPPSGQDDGSPGTRDAGMARLRVVLRGVEPARLSGLAGPTPLGAALSRIAAPVSLDLVGGLGPDGRALPLSGSLRVGAGVLDLPGMAEPVPVDRARADLHLSPDRRHLDLRDLVIDSATLRLSGRADLRSAAVGGMPESGAITVQLALRDVAVDAPRPGRPPMALRADRLWADLRLRGPDGAIDIAALTVEDGGARATGRGQVGPGGGIALDLAAERLDVAGALALWPVDLAPRARIWMAQTVSAGGIHDLRLSLRHDMAAPRAAGRADNVALTFAVRDATMRIDPRLPPVSGLSGQVVVDDNRAVLLLARARMDVGPDVDPDVDPVEDPVEDPGGGIGPVWLGPGQVWTETGPDATAPLRMRFDAAGDLPAALALLRAPLFQPAAVAATAATATPVAPDAPDAPAGPGAVLMTPGAVTGRMAVTVDVTLPMRRRGPPPPAGTRPDFTVEGDIVAARSDVLLPGRAVQADRLVLHADQWGLRIAGQAQVGSLPVDMVYSRALTAAPPVRTPRPVRRGQAAAPPPPIPAPGRGRLVADLPLRPADLAEAGVSLPPGALRGEGRARVEIDFGAPGPPAVSLDADLAGLSVSFPGLGLAKSANGPGRITATGRLGLDPGLDRATLDMPGAEVALRLPDGWTGGVLFDRLAVGGWLDVRGRYDPPSPGRPARLVLTGGTADLRRMPARAKGAGGPPMAMALSLDRVTLADGIALTGLRGALSPDLHGVLEARVDGAAPVRLRLAPGDGSPSDRGPALHLTADDGGAVLRAAGLASGVKAGALDLRLVPAAAPGRYRGQLRLAGLDLPAGGAAALRAGGGTAPDAGTGSGGGHAFDDVRAEFTLDPARIDIHSASATGSSLGLALDGRVDLRNRRLALQGVVSPLYFLNRMGAFMTRQGEGLIGLHFRLTGPIDAPELTTNPLSVLTPGPLRDIFRMRPPAAPDQATEDRE